MSDPNDGATVATGNGTEAMRNATWNVFVAGILISTAAIADDGKSSDPGNAMASTLSRAVGGLLADSTTPPRLPLDASTDDSSYGSRELHPIANIRFRDGSVMGRVSKLRSISFLTLAEDKKTRLFLGVNGDGLVGLHFVASSKQSDERYLSLARMPYLKRETAAK